ncbi:MAG: hypothetical protein [Bacteriophage sp.]|nr:MAG: hypothetical protein [Bacteriophage sp.]
MTDQIPPGQSAVLKAFESRFGLDKVPSKKAIAMICVSTGYGIPTVVALMGKAALAGRLKHTSEYEVDSLIHYYQLA